MFIIMKTQEIVDVRVGESTQPDYGYELSDRCIITKSSNAVASGAGSKGLFSFIKITPSGKSGVCSSTVFHFIKTSFLLIINQFLSKFIVNLSTAETCELLSKS